MKYKNSNNDFFGYGHNTYYVEERGGDWYAVYLEGGEAPIHPCGSSSKYWHSFEDKKMCDVSADESSINAGLLKPHKHAAIIKAWADGAEIEWRADLRHGWKLLWTKQPYWEDEYDYRVKPVSHKWQKEMDAYKAGKVIQYQDSWTDGKWIDARHPNWECVMEKVQFRIKPESVERLLCVRPQQVGYPMETGVPPNLKLTFEDNKLVKAEVL